MQLDREAEKQRDRDRGTERNIVIERQIFRKKCCRKTDDESTSVIFALEHSQRYKSARILHANIL